MSRLRKAFRTNTTSGNGPALSPGLYGATDPLAKDEVELEVPESHLAIANERFFGLENVRIRDLLRTEGFHAVFDRETPHALGNHYLWAGNRADIVCEHSSGIPVTATLFFKRSTTVPPSASSSNPTQTPLPLQYPAVPTPIKLPKPSKSSLLMVENGQPTKGERMALEWARS